MAPIRIPKFATLIALLICAAAVATMSRSESPVERNLPEGKVLATVSGAALDTTRLEASEPGRK